MTAIQHAMQELLGNAFAHTAQVAVVDVATMADVLAKDAYHSRERRRWDLTGRSLLQECTAQAWMAAATTMAYTAADGSTIYICFQAIRNIAARETDLRELLTSADVLDILLAHELVHVSQAHNPLVKEALGAGDPRAAAALSALMEGHAQYVTRLVAEHRGQLAAFGAVDEVLRRRNERHYALGEQYYRQRVGSGASAPGTWIPPPPDPGALLAGTSSDPPGGRLSPDSIAAAVNILKGEFGAVHVRALPLDLLMELATLVPVHVDGVQIEARRYLGSGVEITHATVLATPVARSAEIEQALYAIVARYYGPELAQRAVFLDVGQGTCRTFRDASPTVPKDLVSQVIQLREDGAILICEVHGCLDTAYATALAARVMKGVVNGRADHSSTAIFDPAAVVATRSDARRAARMLAGRLQGDADAMPEERESAGTEANLRLRYVDLLMLCDRSPEPQLIVDSCAAVRYRAWKTIIARADIEQYRASLATGIDDADEHVRALVATKLSAFGDLSRAKREGLYRRLLADTSARVRAGALGGLLDVHDDEVSIDSSMWRDLLATPETAEAAARGVRVFSVKGDMIERGLRGLIGGAASHTRFEAACGLLAGDALMTSEERDIAIREVLLGSTEYQEGECLAAIDRRSRGDVDLAPILRAAFSSPFPRVRRQALLVAKRKGVKDVWECGLQLAADSDPAVREAARRLGE